MTLPSAPLLEARQVTKTFGGLIAVREVDLTIPGGAIVSVIGPNGAGKTTLFNVIAGIYRLDGGRVTSLVDSPSIRSPRKVIVPPSGA